MDEFINRITNYQLLTEEEIALICDKVVEIMYSEPNIRRVDKDAIVVGDIHGQFSDLLNIFEICGSPKSTSYVFLGDYVDRGENSLEVIIILLIYKILYPENISLIRGNHECRNINKIYGFNEEIYMKYNSHNVWNLINNVFPAFQIGAIIYDRYLCVHGGISIRITINKLDRIDRFEDNVTGSLINDLLWSDPWYLLGSTHNPRGSGYLFGIDVLKEFLMVNNLDMIIRSHQLAIEGFKFDLDGLCLTVWSAPDYMGKCSNPGSVLRIEKDVPVTARSLKMFYKKKPNE